MARSYIRVLLGILFVISLVQLANTQPAKAQTITNNTLYISDNACANLAGYLNKVPPANIAKLTQCQYIQPDVMRAIVEFLPNSYGIGTQYQTDSPTYWYNTAISGNPKIDGFYTPSTASVFCPYSDDTNQYSATDPFRIFGNNIRFSPYLTSWSCKSDKVVSSGTSAMLHRTLLPRALAATNTTTYTVRGWIFIAMRPTVQLSVSQTSVNAGSSISLNWSSQYANSLTSTPNLGNLALPSGSLTTTVNSTTTYTFTACNDHFNPTVNQSCGTLALTVNVVQLPDLIVDYSNIVATIHHPDSSVSQQGGAGVDVGDNLSSLDISNIAVKNIGSASANSVVVDCTIGIGFYSSHFTLGTPNPLAANSSVMLPTKSYAAGQDISTIVQGLANVGTTSVPLQCIVDSANLVTEVNETNNISTLNDYLIWGVVETYVQNDSNGSTPIPMAQVNLTSSDNSIIDNSLTDSNGEAYFIPVRLETSFVVVSTLGGDPLTDSQGGQVTHQARLQKLYLKLLAGRKTNLIINVTLFAGFPNSDPYPATNGVIILYPAADPQTCVVALINPSGYADFALTTGDTYILVPDYRLVQNGSYCTKSYSDSTFKNLVNSGNPTLTNTLGHTVEYTWGAAKGQTRDAPPTFFFATDGKLYTYSMDLYLYGEDSCGTFDPNSTTFDVCYKDQYDFLDINKIKKYNSIATTQVNRVKGWTNQPLTWLQGVFSGFQLGGVSTSQAGKDCGFSFLGKNTITGTPIATQIYMDSGCIKSSDSDLFTQELYTHELMHVLDYSNGGASASNNYRSYGSDYLTSLKQQLNDYGGSTDYGRKYWSASSSDCAYLSSTGSQCTGYDGATLKGLSDQDMAREGFATEMATACTFQNTFNSRFTIMYEYWWKQLFGTPPDPLVKTMEDSAWNRTHADSYKAAWFNNCLTL